MDKFIFWVLNKKTQYEKRKYKIKHLELLV